MLGALLVVAGLVRLAATYLKVVPSEPALGAYILAAGVLAIAGALVFAALSPSGPAVAASPAVSAVAAVADEVARNADTEAPAEVAGSLVRPGDDLWSIAEQVLGTRGG